MIEKLIKKLAKILDKEEIPYMIIGGQAVLLYGRPRLTQDIDITLGIDTDKFALIEKVCGSLGLKMLAQKPYEFAMQTRVVPAEDKKTLIRVDFIFSFSDYEAKAIERVRKVKIDGYSVKFASCEDVIIHKLIAGRAIDEEDIKSIMLKNKDIDIKYIRKCLTGFEKMNEFKGILDKFNKVVKRNVKRGV
jgi:predicted nucleotidyltransferase